MQRFKHILVPVDLTDKNTAALDIAQSIAQQSHARITLLHVIETIEHLADAEIQNFYDMLESSAQEKLEIMATRLLDENVTVGREIIFGPRGREIVRYTADHNIDLVVLSSHRVDPTHPNRGWSTLSYQVSVLCPCPVLLVK